MGMHDERPDRPGYTAEGRAAGRAAVIATGVPPAPSVEDWVATFYHRVPLLDPSLAVIGFGHHRGGPDGWVTVLRADGRRRPREPVLLYPADGQLDVPTRGDGTGFPLTATFVPGRTVRAVEATLTEAGKELAVKVLAPGSDDEARRTNTVAVVPADPLRPGVR